MNMKYETDRIGELMINLLDQESHYFPPRGKGPDATDKKGVYVIYSPSGIALHVGCTPRARRGINQRISDHLHGNSSFARNYLKRKGKNLRNQYLYQFLPVRSSRQMVLLESARDTTAPEFGVGTKLSGNRRVAHDV